MASSGTIGLVIDFRLKPDGGREEALIAGRTQIKNAATIEARDLELRTIKMFFINQHLSTVRSGAPQTAFGSVTVAGSLMNSVYVRSLRGSIVPHTGTQHVGTSAGGTTKISFMAIGA